MREKGRPFGIRDKIGYMLGDLGNDFTFIFASTYVMIFYSKVMGINTGIIGTMFLISRCIDAFTDIGMGRIVDISKTAKDGRFKCWIRRMCGPVALASFMMYQSFLQNAPMEIKIAYMFITYLLWGSVFYTAINIPYGSMASVISNNPKDRSSLSVFRSMGGVIAMIIIRIVAPLVIYYTDEVGNQVVHAGRFTLIAGVFSVCAIICYIFCYYMTTERVHVESKKEDAKRKSSILKTLKKISCNRAFIGMILSALVLLFATLMEQGITNYLFADVFKNVKALAISSVMAVPAMVIIAVVSTPMCAKFGKKEVGFVGCALAGLVYLGMAVFRTDNVWFFVAGSFLALLGRQSFSMQSYALVTDVIDDIEVTTHERNDGVIYGAYSFSRKIGQAIAGGVSGWALAAIGYDSLAVAQTESVCDGIYMLSTLAPALSCLLCALILAVVYPLGKKKVDENTEILKCRR